MKIDFRHAVIFSRVEELTVDGLRIPFADGAAKAIVMHDVQAHSVADAPQFSQLHEESGAVSKYWIVLEAIEGRPFFWRGDPGWGLLNRVDLKEAKYYFATRLEQRFNVIQVFVAS